MSCKHRQSVYPQLCKLNVDGVIGETDQKRERLHSPLTGGGSRCRIRKKKNKTKTKTKPLKRENGNTDKRMSFRLVFVDWTCTCTCSCVEFHGGCTKWQHLKLMNVRCPHIFGQRYISSINNFSEFRGSTLNLNGFRIVVLCYSIIGCTRNFLANG